MKCRRAILSEIGLHSGYNSESSIALYQLFPATAGASKMKCRRAILSEISLHSGYNSFLLKQNGKSKSVNATFLFKGSCRRQRRFPCSVKTNSLFLLHGGGGRKPPPRHKICTSRTIPRTCHEMLSFKASSEIPRRFPRVDFRLKDF